MNENKQISSRARKLLPSAVWANVRWKRDGYYRTSPSQNRRWLVVGFRIRPISLGKSRRFYVYVHRPAPFRGFATRTKKKKKKKKKKADLRRERGVRPNPPNPPCVRACCPFCSLFLVISPISWFPDSDCTYYSTS